MLPLRILSKRRRCPGSAWPRGRILPALLALQAWPVGSAAQGCPPGPQGCRRVAGRGARTAVRTGHTDGALRLLETVRKAAEQHRGGRRWPVREELGTPQTAAGLTVSPAQRGPSAGTEHVLSEEETSRKRDLPLRVPACVRAGSDQRAARPGEGWPDLGREPTEHSRGCPSPARRHCGGLHFHPGSRPAGSCPHDRGRCLRGGSPWLPGLHGPGAAPAHQRASPQRPRTAGP